MILLPTLAHEMNLKKITLSQEGWEAIGPNGEDVVRCECACKIDDGVMVGIPCNETSSFSPSHDAQFQCESCDTWQHQACYGFSQEPSAARHVCYKCLLEDGNRSVLSSMEKLAQRRRALWLVHYQNCPASPKALQASLGKCAIATLDSSSFNIR